MGTLQGTHQTLCRQLRKLVHHAVRVIQDRDARRRREGLSLSYLLMHSPSLAWEDICGVPCTPWGSFLKDPMLGTADNIHLLRMGPTACATTEGGRCWGFRQHGREPDRRD